MLSVVTTYGLSFLLSVVKNLNTGELSIPQTVMEVQPKVCLMKCHLNAKLSLVQTYPMVTKFSTNSNSLFVCNVCMQSLYAVSNRGLA